MQARAFDFLCLFVLSYDQPPPIARGTNRAGCTQKVAPGPAGPGAPKGRPGRVRVRARATRGIFPGVSTPNPTPPLLSCAWHVRGPASYERRLAERKRSGASSGYEFNFFFTVCIDLYFFNFNFKF